MSGSQPPPASPQPLCHQPEASGAGDPEAPADLTRLTLSDSLSRERTGPPVHLPPIITDPINRAPSTMPDTSAKLDDSTPVAMVLPTPVTARPRGATVTGARNRSGADHSPPDAMAASVHDTATRDMASDYEARRFMGSAGMGTSALVSAVTALPWDQEEDSATDDDGDADSETSDDGHVAWKEDMARSMFIWPPRPKNSQMHSSLRTIRAMDTSTTSPSTEQQSAPPSGSQHLSPLSRREREERESPTSPTSPGGSKPSPSPTSRRARHHLFPRHSLDFPYKENVISRRAREPPAAELSYQFAPESEDEVRPPPRAGSSATLRPAESTPAPNAPAVSTSPPLLEAPESTDTKAVDTAGEKRVRMEKLGCLLQDVFGLEEQEDVIEELPCWLLRSDMLKGYMFLTRHHICFFAHMPDADEDVAIKSSPLWKKHNRTKLHTRYWFVLRNGVLSWYENSHDPYFPKGVVSLQYASSCDMTGETKFKLQTTERNYTFQSDSADNANEWVRTIQKVIFKTQNEGGTVKVIIPLEAVVDVERSPTLEFAETVEIKVVDSDDAMSVDSYFFASFPDNDYAYELLLTLLRERSVSELPRVVTPPPDLESYQQDARRTSTSQLPFSRLGTVLRPFSSEPQAPGSRVPIAPPPLRTLPQQSSIDSTITERDDSSQLHDLGYPPQQQGPPPPGMTQPPPAGWSPDWIRKPASKIFGSSPTDTDFPTDRSAMRRRPLRRNSVTEVVEPYMPSTDEETSADESRKSMTSHRRDASGGSMKTMSSRLLHSQSDYSMASDAGEEEDEVMHKFHVLFALPEREELLAHFTGSLYRVLPVHGTFYISQNHFCFKSSGLLNKTRMIVPISQLYGMKAQKAFRFGHHGLVVIIKGQEELFLEFHSSKRRDNCQALLEERMDAYREKVAATKALQAAMPREPHLDDLDETPPEMFDSASSSFLQFKPPPMNITCLTIGSRGDVQPYIALCKGLRAEGHTCTIATHAEYQHWVEGHGIGFKSVGGDPAKLMELCVDNGMFSVAFLKEGLAQFRGWLDDLLNDSWRACQGADLLIESPSAMAGIHVAEALQIPYYRAFTMPWTRTRAYPQAFAVPDHKRGGTYNYMTYVIFDQVFWRAISGQVNRWRRNVLGLESTTLDKMEQDKVPFLYNFSPKVVPPPLDWTEWIHVTGYWFLDHADSSEAKAKAWAPPAGLEDFMEGARSRGQKIVYIGFGSIVVSDPQEMTRCVVQAVIDAGVCAILSKGWSDRGSRGTTQTSDDDKEKGGADGIAYPPEIFWLFPRIDAACHHGGAGTTGASLRAGIPTIIKPFFGDQMFWAERMESLGVGAAVRKLTAESLSEALIEATRNERQIAKAKVVGESIRQEDGVMTAIESIYRDLEYAKSIIKPLPVKTNPLERIVSASLQSMRSTGSSVLERTRSRSRRHSREPSGDHGGTSDESWSVVSDSGRDNRTSVYSESEDSDHPLRKRQSIGQLFGHLAHRLHKDA